MRSEDALRSTGLALLRKPATVLPAFLAVSATSVVQQVAWFVGIVLAYISLLGTGRLQKFATAWGKAMELLQESESPAEVSDEALNRALETLVMAGMDLFTPTVLVLLGIGISGAIILGVLMRAILAGAKVHTAMGVMAGDPPLVDAIRGTRRDLVSFLGFTVVQVVVFGVLGTVAVVGPVLAIGGLVATFQTPVGGIVGLILGTALFGGAVIGGVVAYLGLLFVPEAIAVENQGFVRAIGSNVEYLRTHPGRAAVYVVLDVMVRLSVFVVAIGLNIVNMGRVVGLITVILVAPVLGLFKMGLFGDFTPPFADRPGYELDEFRTSLTSGIRRSASEFGRFVVYHAHLILVSLVLFGVGGVAGWLATSGLGVELPDSENQALFGAFGTIPIDDLFNLAANNWLVAVGHSFGGLGFGIPTITNLLFNGLIIGALAGLSGTHPVVFAALIVPHGILEIPALSVSGALGLSLGWEGVKYVRGSNSTEDLAGAIRRAFYILVALIPVFLVAAFLETIVTPFVGRAARAVVGA